MRKLLIAMLLMFTTAGCGEFFYSRDVTGQVQGVGSRWKGGSQGGGSEKIALQLTNYTADATIEATAGGAGVLSIECLSTRCAALGDGQCISLECLKDNRVLEPSVVQCKFKKLIACPEGN